jgi:hypothetical protein
MNKGKLLVLLVSLALTSCGTAIKTLSGFKNPKVEDKKELNSYFSELVPNSTTYFLKVKETGNEYEIFRAIGSGLTNEISIYSQSGEKYCYQGVEECSGIQMQSAFKNFNENYSPCKDESALKLSSYLEKLLDINGNSIKLENLPNADYYIFQHWNKYSGSEKRLKEDINWLLDLKKNSNLNVALLFVNGDMLEEWGLEKNGELPIKFKKDGDKFTMTFGELPLKK